MLPEAKNESRQSIGCSRSFYLILYLTLTLYLRQLHITGTGTTQQQLTVPDFRKTEIIIPDKNTMDSFTETVTPLFEQIWANEDENTKLAEVRDALLPKLMSGEIDVSDIQL